MFSRIQDAWKSTVAKVLAKRHSIIVMLYLGHTSSATVAAEKKGKTNQGNQSHIPKQHSKKQGFALTLFPSLERHKG